MNLIFRFMFIYHIQCHQCYLKICWAIMSWTSHLHNQCVCWIALWNTIRGCFTVGSQTLKLKMQWKAYARIHQTKYMYIHIYGCMFGPLCFNFSYKYDVLHSFRVMEWIEGEERIDLALFSLTLIPVAVTLSDALHSSVLSWFVTH